MAAKKSEAWEQARIELTIMAAEALKNVSFIGSMRPYAVAWVDSSAKHSTRVLSKAGKNPVWNDDISLPVEDAILFNPAAYLILQVRNQDLFSDSIVGTAYFPLYELVRMSQLNRGNEEGSIITLRLQRPSGKMRGIIRFSVRLVGGSVLGSTGQEESGFGAVPAPVPETARAPAPAPAPADGVPVMGYAVPQQYPQAPPPGTPYPAPAYPAYAPAPGHASSSQAPTYAFPPGSFGEPKPHYASPQAAYPYSYPVPVPPPHGRRHGNGAWAIATGILGGLLLGEILF